MLRSERVRESAEERALRQAQAKLRTEDVELKREHVHELVEERRIKELENRDHSAEKRIHDLTLEVTRAFVGDGWGVGGWGRCCEGATCVCACWLLCSQFETGGARAQEGTRGGEGGRDSARRREGH